MKLVLISIAALAVLVPDTLAQRGFGRGDMTEVWKHLASRYDKDRDGKITKEEYNRGPEKFETWDSDGDGVITRRDLENRGPRQGANRNRPNRADNRANRGNPASDLVLGRHVVRPADLDKDDKVTETEWAAFVKKLDCNEDGLVSGEELNLSYRRFRMVKTAIDANRDGDVQVQEVAAIFVRLDRDKNKELSAQEIGGGGNRRAAGNQAGVPQPGQMAPDFDLPLAEQPRGASQPVTIKLSSFAGKKPVALIFGSYT